MPSIQSIFSSSRSVDAFKSVSDLPLDSVQRVFDEADEQLTPGAPLQTSAQANVQDNLQERRHERLQEHQQENRQAQRKANTQEKTSEQPSSIVQLSSATNGPVDGVKEGIRRRLGRLSGQADALLQRIQLAMPQQLESLAKELKRLAQELKQMVAHYKAINEMAAPVNQGAFSFSTNVDDDSEQVVAAHDSRSQSVPTNNLQKFERAASDLDSAVSVIEIEHRLAPGAQKQAMDAMLSDPKAGLALDDVKGAVQPSIQGADGAKNVGSQEINLYKEVSAGNGAESLDSQFRFVFDKLELAKSLLQQHAQTANREDDGLNSSLVEVSELLKDVDTQISQRP